MTTHWLLGVLVMSVAGSSPALVQDTIREGSELDLGEVLESALRTHPSLVRAEARLAAAEASVGEARSARLPTLSATAVATRFQEPMVVAPLHGFDIRTPPAFDETLYQAHASAEYALFDGGGRSARIQGNQSLEASARSGVVMARDAVLVEATTAYLAALTARDVLLAHEERVGALEQELDRARLLFAEGTTARLAVLRSEAALSRARAERAAAEEGLRLARRRLARVSGVEAARVMGAGLAPVTIGDTTLPPRDVLLAEALERNPGLTEADRRVAAAETRVTAARSAYLPRISLTGRYSAFAAASTDPVGEWQAGLQVSYPLFTGGARGAGVERAVADAVAARAEARLAERRVADAVDSALLAYRSALARVTALEAAERQSAEVARIEALALASGAGVQTDYLRAEAELLETRSGLAEARHAVVEARVRLAQAAGTLTTEWAVRITEGTEQ